MSNQPAAIKATFSDFRLIRGRKVCQIVLEVPIEEADAALSVLGGLPQPQSERWLGVARLAFETAEDKSSVTMSNGNLIDKENKTKLSLQAVMRCKEPLFHHFLLQRYSHVVTDEVTAANVVRSLCGISSRRGLNTDEEAAQKWRKMEAEYTAWARCVE